MKGTIATGLLLALAPTERVQVPHANYLWP